MRTFLLVLAALAAAALIASVVGGRMVLRFVETPHAAQGAVPRVVVVEPDMAPDALAQALVTAGVVGQLDWFTLYLGRLYRGPAAQPGEYALSPSMTPAEIMDRVGRGQVVTYPVTVSPGESSREIIDNLAAVGLGNHRALELAMRDGALASRLRVPSSTLEGFLFADTYTFPKGLAAEAILERMVQAHQRSVSPKILEDGRLRGYTELELITAASLIETSELPERDWPQLSGLIRHRLDDKIPLENDAALAYGLHKRTRELDAADRATDGPFNTFTRAGLPPGPIASPGLAAIAAAAAPAGDARFYAPRPDRAGYIFCPDEECHHLALDAAGLPIPRRLSSANARRKKGR